MTKTEKSPENMDGIIIVNKPAGFTSQDVVAKLRGICKMKRIGHTGTLDPDATGVLPVCLGKACRLCDMLTDRDKEYIAELLLGVETDTLDMSGQILREDKEKAGKLTEDAVRTAIMSFVGEYDQTPPMYSAIKINGKKLYELAREGVEVERKKRRISIKELEITDMDIPTVGFRVVCSKGTYIRSLCSDIGEKLECGGSLKSLIRSRSGEFTLKEAHTLEELQMLKDEERLSEVMLPTDYVFKDLPLVHIKEPSEKLINNGNPFSDRDISEEICEGEALGLHNVKQLRVYRTDGSFAGIYGYDREKRKYMPIRLFI